MYINILKFESEHQYFMHVQNKKSDFLNVLESRNYGFQKSVYFERHPSKHAIQIS